MCLGCAALPSTLALGGVLRGRGIAPLAAAPGAAPGRATLPLLPVALVLGLAALAVFGPGTLSYKLDVLGFGVCHQLLTHTYSLGGLPLPVCARCTGIYLGAGMTWLVASILRPRAVGLPSARMLPLLALMFLTMAADGINSTFQSLPGGHGLWLTTNPLRIVTGALAGMAVAFLLYPLFNETFWRPTLTRPEPVLEGPSELFGYGVAVAVPVALVLSAAGDPTTGWAYWLLALASMSGLLLLLTLANTMIVALVTRRNGYVSSTSSALTVLSVALILALAELLLLSAGRGALAGVIVASGAPPDLPLVPGVR